MRLLPLITVGLIAGATVTPAHAQDAMCEAAAIQIGALERTFPADVDSVTKTVGVDLFCDKKQVVQARSIDLKQSTMQPDYMDYLQKQDNAQSCGVKERRALIDAGWTWSSRYTFQGGETVLISAKCG